MGCVTSKVMTRTGSFREELSRSLKKRYGDFPPLQGLLISSSRKGDGDPSIVDENEATKHLDHETINMRDLMADLEEEQVEKHEEHNAHEDEVDGSNHIVKRSQSFCQSSFNEYGVHDEEKKNIRVRSRSFHTVAEYDAIIMEMNGNGCTRYKQEKGWEDKLEHFLTSVTCSKTCPEAVEEMEGKSYKPGNIFNQENDKGIRRMRRAKDLTSLAIPSTIEFPVATNHKDASEEYNGQLLNYGDFDCYVTPKFGSFELPIQSHKYRCSVEEIQEEKSVFDPELLSSFQVAMEQLQVEEEFLLHQMTKKI